MTEKLSVCFVWHMHQPLYKDRLSGTYLMPWVRLHAIKDYLDMLKVLENYPNLKQTFNLVPSLLDQLEDYAKHEAVDRQLSLTCAEIENYTEDDKVFILEESFHCNFDRQIKLYAPYLALYKKHQDLIAKGAVHSAMTSAFTNQEYADMSTWMNLAWFDPIWYAKYEDLRKMRAQGKDFTLAQRKRLIEIERTIIAEIVPTYRALQQRKQIEVITTAFYHPILPLLIDSNVACISAPSTALPQRVYLHSADAKQQVESGLSYCEKLMGQRPLGLWPSEMAISPQALELIASCGVKWVVADEAMLTKTTSTPISRDEYGNLNSAELLCQPYEVVVGDEKINVFFRESVISNEIAFSYGHRLPHEAANALHMRLKHIQQRLLNSPREGVVVIALDGENCWETYELDGNAFLNELYRRLSLDKTLNVCTVSDYLERNPATEKLYNMHSGSWVDADYHIWIGDPVKNTAWDLLGETRNFLVEQLEQNEYSEDVQQKAWAQIYSAEGSDWFWWFGEPNNSAQDHIFDRQFRLMLQNVYQLLDKPHPKELDVPVEDLVNPKKEPVVVEIATAP